MKKVLFILFVLFAALFMSSSLASCKTGYGCPAEEQYKEKQSKPLSKQRGKSRLFKEG